MLRHFKAGAMLALMLCSAACFVGCNNLQENSAPAEIQKVEEGSIKIVQRDAFRSLSTLSQITSAKVTVSGTGIGEIQLGTVSLNGFAGGTIVSGIPVGTNRIITLQGLDSDGKEISGLKYRAVASVSSTATEVVIDETTTALGNVFEVLRIEEFNLASVDISAIENAIDASVGFARINAQQIAYDYIDGVLGSASNYVLAAGSVVFDCYLADGTYSAEVNDSSSSTKTAISAGKGIEISGVSPGVWTFFLYDGNDNVVYQTSINVESNEVTDLGAVYDEGIVIVVDADKYSSYNHLYAWVNNSPILAGWPGVQMNRNGNYYVYQIKNYSSVGVLVNTAGGSKLVSGDMTIPSEGVYVISSSSSGTLTAEETYSYTEKVITKRNTASGITVYAYERTNVWAWNANGISGNVFASWPGQAMISEGNGWYKWTFEDTESLMVMFNSGSNSGKTEETQLSEAGSYWWKEGSWYRQNPDGPVTPVVTASLDSGTYSSAKTVTLSSSYSSDVIYYTLDGTIPTSESAVYTSAITVSESAVLKAVSYNAESALWSDVITRNYVINIVENENIVVHAYQRTYVWAWNANGISGNVFASWPGQKMNSEGNDLYGWTFENTSSLMIMFNNGGDNGKTAEKQLSSAGEYWYVDGTWYSSNPFDDVSPVLVSFTSDKTGTVSGNVVLTVNARDNAALSNVVITLDGNTTLTTISLSGTESTASYTWNTIYTSNGNHSLSCVVYDNAGNVSESREVNFTTYNENLPPVAVISGAKKVQINKTVSYKADKSYDQNNGTIPSYKWTVSGATAVSSLTGETLTVKVPASVGASFTITLTVKDNEGLSSETVSYECSTVNTDSDWDFRDETIYFLMTTRFYDGNTGNNLYCWDEGGEYLKYGAGDCAWRGDFAGLIEKLDYIKALGFTSVWITPVVVNASGIDYHGYHAYDFSHVDPRYGSGNAKYDVNGDDISGDEAYQELINAVHDKGMKIIQDIVLNHTGNWGEKNINHLFDKGEIYTDSNGYKRCAPMVPNEDSPILNAAERVIGSEYVGNYAKSITDLRDYDIRLEALKGDATDPSYYHHEENCEYYDITQQMGSMAGDCVDLNTENPLVQQYLIDAYTKYIEMGVDAFRIDTTKHISRLIFNEVFNPAFLEAACNNGNEKFFMFGEVCARYRGRWNEQLSQVSPSFYTWKEDNAGKYDLSSGWTVAEIAAKATPVYQHWSDYATSIWESKLASLQPSISNTYLNGNSYHTPDYSNYSGLSVIDFPMHWAFNSTYDAYNTALSYDSDYNDATWNVTYVDSHDYAPDNAPENQRYTGNWPDKLNLMFTFRGIPCIYYGSEIEFMKGYPIDPANQKTSLENSGRAYFGDYLKGSVTASDFGEYSASGTVANTLNNSLAQHIIRLNKIRRAIPALRKGQYSTEGCNGSIAFKRRYTSGSVDSFALVAINGQATFNGIPGGTYVEVVTGKTVYSNGSLTSDLIGQDNMRVYVLQTNDGVEPTGKIGTDGAYLY